MRVHTLGYLQVGESQFVTLNSVKNVAEFVRADETEVTLNFEMHHHAALGHEKSVYKTQLPMAALDGTKVSPSLVTGTEPIIRNSENKKL